MASEKDKNPWEHSKKLNELMDRFNVGHKYTLYEIGAWSAMTHQQEIKVVGVEDRSNIIFTKAPRGRKRFILRLLSRAYQSAPFEPWKGALFEGWNQPIVCHTAAMRRDGVRVMRGNACYNFIGETAKVRLWIQGGQLNPFFDRTKAMAILPDLESVCGDGAIEPVFPEEYEGGHAVIDRMLAANR